MKKIKLTDFFTGFRICFTSLGGAYLIMLFLVWVFGDVRQFYQEYSLVVVYLIVVVSLMTGLSYEEVV